MCIKVTKYCLQLSHLNVPVPVPHVVEAQLVSDLSWVHGLGQVLLVGKHQQHRVSQLVLSQLKTEFSQRGSRLGLVYGTWLV